MGWLRTIYPYDRKIAALLLLELGPNDPGVLVTQSVHKQQAGFSQTSQIHKKDKHVKGQDRYVNHKRLNNAFMMHASTSPSIHYCST